MSNKPMYRYLITTMLVALTMIPHTVMAQWDIDTVDDPDPSLDTYSQNDSTVSQDTPTSLITMTRTLGSDNRAGVQAGDLTNKIDPTTIISYAKGGGAGSILCSTIARINLNNLTGKPYNYNTVVDSTIPRGDAYALALRGDRDGQMIRSSHAGLETDLWSEYARTTNTIFDVYFYKGGLGGVMQGHRAVVFIGTDDRIYILDPIRGLRGSKPQLLADHFDADPYKGYTIFISKVSYQPKSELKTIHESYQANNNTSISDLLAHNIAQIKPTVGFTDDVQIEIMQPLTMIDNNETITLEVGAIITVKNTNSPLGWNLVFKPLPSGSTLEAKYTKPKFSTLIAPLDRNYRK